MPDCHIKDFALSEKGEQRINWAGQHMPVLAELARESEKTKPLAGKRISACLHVTTETANLAIALKKAGAEVRLCASNPLSTQDDVAAALWVNHGIPVFAIHGEDKQTYYQHLEQCLGQGPHITMDDGGDLTSFLHTKAQSMIPTVIGGTEETTTGVIRFRAMETQGVLQYPIIAVNDSLTKHLFDNRYGTGQSTIDGVLRLTNALIAGKTFAVFGYGWCGRGVAARARGMGARVIVVETDPVRALEAAMDGHTVMSGVQALANADIAITVTGNKNAISKAALENAKDGLIVANSGHFDVEIDIPGLKELSVSEKEVRPQVVQYTLRNGNRINLLAGGRLVNLAGAEGHPPEVMDMSFANQFLAAVHLVEHAKTMQPKVYTLPREIDHQIASAKLKTMGMTLEQLSQEQVKYLSDWREGT